MLGILAASVLGNALVEQGVIRAAKDTIRARRVFNAYPYFN